MSHAVRLRIAGASPYSIDPMQLRDAYELADELIAAGFDPVTVEVAAPERGTPMASGVGEWLYIFIGGPAAGTLTTLVVTDLYRRAKLWVHNRMADPEHDSMRFGHGIIYGPDGRTLREWHTERKPGGTVFEID